jgi:prepilin-type processing-associated H-X9-DG protein
MAHNASDPFNSLPTPARHGSGNNVLYLDGHIVGQVPGAK